jgi:hypothetical protein
MLFSRSVCGLGGAKLHSPGLRGPNGKIIFQFRRVLVADGHDTGGDGLAADAVELKHKPVAQDARGVGSGLALFHRPDHPRRVLPELLRGGIPEVTQRAAVHADVDGDLASLVYVRARDLSGMMMPVVRSLTTASCRRRMFSSPCRMSVIANHKSSDKPHVQKAAPAGAGEG